MKEQFRVLGIDDGHFEPRKGSTILVGVLFRVDNRIEGIASTKVKVDSLDSTSKIISMIKNGKYHSQIACIILGGVNFAGFNIADIQKINYELNIPVIVVSRRKPRMEKIKKALLNFKDSKKRLKLIENAGKIHKFENIHFQTAGISLKQAQVILKKCSHHSNLPEPVRLAHLIASGVTLGESTRPK